MTLAKLTPDKPGMSEIQIQTKAYQYLHNTYPLIRGLLFHVPNGGNRNAIEGMQLKASGVIPGIPDLLLIIPVATTGTPSHDSPTTTNNSPAQLTYIEVKKPGGYLSTQQTAIHATWAQNGVTGIVAYSSKEIVDYVCLKCGFKRVEYA